MDDVISFTKTTLPYGWLGNMSAHPIVHEGLSWRTAEALFQALRFAADSEVRELIRAERSPIGAKLTAKSRQGKMVVVPCSREDVASMEAVIRLKVEQHPDLRLALRQTENRPIVEDVSARRSAGNNRFWGAALVNGVWIGDNTLGKIWEKVRQDIMENEA